MVRCGIVGSAVVVAVAVTALRIPSVWAGVMGLSRIGTKNVQHARSPLNSLMNWSGKISARCSCILTGLRLRSLVLKVGSGFLKNSRLAQRIYAKRG
jgi:hypothetical protein